MEGRWGPLYGLYKGEDLKVVFLDEDSAESARKFHADDQQRRAAYGHDQALVQRYHLIDAGRANSQISRHADGILRR